MTSVQLVDEIRGAPAATGDPEKAVREQAYVKSALPFRGVQLPEVWHIVKRLPEEHPLVDRDQWERAIRELWDKVMYWEYWYAALEIVGYHDARDWRDLGALELYRHLAATGTWRDVVDGTTFPPTENMAVIAPGARAVVWGWATGDDLWLRRIFIICQLQRKIPTDLELLGHTIDPSLEGPQHSFELFIRKAVGWVLRQHTRVDPDWMKAFVETRGSWLSGLNRREALKYL